MKWTDRIRQVKIVLVVIAILMAVASVMVSHRLTCDLEAEEHNKMGVWAEAMRSLNTADENTDLNLVLRVIDENHTIPVIVLNQQGRVQTVRNVDTGRRHDADSTAYVAQMASRLKAGGHYIRIYLDEDHADGYIDVCYDDSLTLKRLAVYPYIQIGAVLLFVGVAVIALLTSKRAEQNRVWVGLSKETAHQLGTPISSLMAWVEILRENYPDDDLIPEMDKDVKRLQLIADRFSKIGSLPEPVPVSLDNTLSHVVDYMDRRTSRRVVISVSHTQGDQTVNLNASLFEWVIENLCKNAVDAMGGDGGKITITTGTSPKGVWIEVADTGKGIPKKDVGNVHEIRVKDRAEHNVGVGGGQVLPRQRVSVLDAADIGGEHAVRARAGQVNAEVRAVQLGQAAGQRGHIGAGRVAAFQHKGQHRGVGGGFPLCRKAQMQRDAAAVEFRSIQRCNANAGRELFTFQIVIPFKYQ